MNQHTMRGNPKKPLGRALLDHEDQLDDRPAPSTLINVPNLLSAVRLAGSALLIILAYMNLREGFLALLIVLLLTDWLDGKLAILLDQQTTFGARLDSVADGAMYSALLFGLWWFIPGFIKEEAAWVFALVGSFGLTSVTSLVKFNVLPSYHTRMAKISWLLTSLGVIVLFADGPRWPARIAMGGVVLTNLEATAITAILPEWRTNVSSLYHALRYRRKTHN